MELKTSKLNRKIGIILNFISLTFLVLIFEFVRLNLLNNQMLMFELLPLTILTISYIIYFWKTKLWKFTHKSIEKLDEREIQLTNNSLRFSYLVFTIFSLSLFILYNLLDIKVNMVVVTSLIYLAHILPSYFIAWTEKPTYEE